MYWRRFALASIPLEDPEKFDAWVRERWLEKEQILEQYVQNGCFPADEGHHHESAAEENGGAGSKVIQGAGFIETEVKLAHWYEVGQIFVVLAAWALIASIILKIGNIMAPWFVGASKGKKG